MKPFSHSGHYTVLSLALSAAFSNSVLAQNVPTPQSTQLKPVVVTATREDTRADELVSEVVVITRADIEANAGRTLTELLSRQAGVQLTSNGGLGKYSSAFVRGTESRHTILLVDGVRVGSATTGAPSWDNIPLDMVERIEVLKGPASALYGSEAVGGVVQVFMKKGVKGLMPSASLTLGSHSHIQAAAGLRGGDGALSYAIGVQRAQDKGEGRLGQREAGQAPVLIEPGEHLGDDEQPQEGLPRLLQGAAPPGEHRAREAPWGSNQHRAALLLGLPGREARHRLGPHLVLQEARPAQEEARRPQRLPRPAPEVEHVVLCVDQAVAEGEARLNEVVHRALRRREGVVRLPLRRARRVIRHHVGVGQREVFAPLTQHAPHVADLLALEDERLVLKAGLGVVTRGHGEAVTFRERLVEAGDELGVGVHRGSGDEGRLCFVI